MSIVGGRIPKNTGKVVRRAAVAGSNALIIGTPVDTGRARGNYVITIGAPRFQVIDNLDPSGSSSLQNAISTINRWKVGKGPIFITNSLPYIVRLDEGYSQQAPSGMSKAAVLAIRRQLVAAKILKGI